MEDERQNRLFSKEEMTVEPNVLTDEVATNIGQSAVWTDNKARFIMLYLRYFVYITKHGTYLDGFAGPQSECETESWAAKLVLDSKPRWLRKFHLCDQKKSQVKMLNELKAAQPVRDDAGKLINRTVEIHQGDFNARVGHILASAGITEKEATFALLDQRTFECDWATVEKLARFKQWGTKIELFYFLANGWLERALSGQKDLDKLARWWGRDDWGQLKAMSREQRRDAIVERMRTDLGYKSVKAYPIYERDDGGGIMYYMIHATDHPEGPVQMSRAYRAAVRADEPFEDRQTDLQFEGQPKDPEAEVGKRTSLSA